MNLGSGNWELEACELEACELGLETCCFELGALALEFGAWNEELRAGCL